MNTHIPPSKHWFYTMLNITMIVKMTNSQPKQTQEIKITVCSWTHTNSKYSISLCHHRLSRSLSHTTRTMLSWEMI